MARAHYIFREIYISPRAARLISLFQRGGSLREPLLPRRGERLDLHRLLERRQPHVQGLQILAGKVAGYWSIRMPHRNRSLSHQFVVLSVYQATQLHHLVFQLFHEHTNRHTNKCE